MNLAIVSRINRVTTVNAKGGSEVWTANFASEMARRQHRIDLYATAGSISMSGVHLIPLTDRQLADYYTEPYLSVSPPDDPTRQARYEERFAATAYVRALVEILKRRDHYDVIVDSVGVPEFTFNSHAFEKPVIAIGHHTIGIATRFYIERFGWPHNATIVFPSRLQFDRAVCIPDERKHIIPHGINHRDFVANYAGGDAMVWMGRIDSRTDKGAGEAAKVATAVGKHLLLTGAYEKTSAQIAFFERAVKPFLSSDVEFKEQGFSESVDKNALLGEAKLMLLPLMWEEPFGLVMLEAMACGTPVVAYARGAVPEVVEDGATGFVVNPSDDDIRGDFTIKKTGHEGLCEAVERVYAMPHEEYAKMRRACRERIEKHFTVEIMADQYEALFKELVNA
ncbi:MAG TPA: glycosyltransferase [Candidatus Paceibacterota bacterium]|nr:glycosyltransferase [Candidatus Paceibacterota bacterium]